MIQDAWGWCTGMTQRDGMGREEEQGSGWGTRVQKKKKTNEQILVRNVKKTFHG